MGPYYQKPENALRRADELIAVGQHAAALESLHEIVLSKRARSLTIASFEQIMLKLVELSAELRKGKIVKEALYQFKNIVQNTSIVAIESVVKKLVGLAESKVHIAQAEADKLLLDVDDLEASETPESILLSTVSGAQSKDRTDRAVVTPWLKFLWESYRTILDILKNNGRLEPLYQYVAGKVFKFCKEYNRKTEFRRLSDVLRMHLTSLPKYAHQAHAIDINDPETLQRHIDTRFKQLDTAVDLELWQEAFRSVEDIQTLIVMAKKSPIASMMMNYYQQLAKIFLVSKNYLFHAAACWRHYQLWRSQNRTGNAEEHTAIAASVVLSAISVPITDAAKGGRSGEVDTRQKDQRLMNLLGLATLPTRATLIKEILTRGVMAAVSPELRSLFDVLEHNFHPITSGDDIGPAIKELTQPAQFAKYAEPIRRLALTRLMQQLSQVYSVIQMDNVLRMAKPFGYDRMALEKFIIQGCLHRELNVKIDHQHGVLHFVSDYFNASSSGVGTPASTFHSHMATFSSGLSSILAQIEGHAANRAALKQSVATARDLVEIEHEKNLNNKVIIEKRKEVAEALLLKKEKEEARERAVQIQQKLAADRVRLEEEARKREIDRIAQERESIQRKEAAKLAASLRGSLPADKVDDLSNLDTNRLMEIQVEQLEKTKMEVQARVKSIAKRMDHVERAYRKEEIPLIEQDYERQKKADLTNYEVTKKVTIETAAEQHVRDLKLKKRMAIIQADYLEYKAQVEAAQRAEYQVVYDQAAKVVDEEKEKRIGEYRALKEQLEAKQREEEETLRLQEEEERRQVEEEERRQREKEEADRKEAEKYAERRKKLDDQAALQRERERLAEEKAAQRAREKEEELKARREAETAKREAEIKAKREAEEARAGSRYQPPSRRETADDAPKAWRRPERSELPNRESAPVLTWRRSVAEETKDTPAPAGNPGAWRRSTATAPSAAAAPVVPEEKKEDKPAAWKPSRPLESAKVDDAPPAGNAWRRSTATAPAPVQEEKTVWKPHPRAPEGAYTPPRRDPLPERKEPVPPPAPSTVEEEDGFTTVIKKKKR